MVNIIFQMQHAAFLRCLHAVTVPRAWRDVTFSVDIHVVDAGYVAVIVTVTDTVTVHHRGNTLIVSRWWWCQEHLKS